MEFIFWPVLQNFLGHPQLTLRMLRVRRERGDEVSDAVWEEAERRARAAEDERAATERALQSRSRERPPEPVAEPVTRPVESDDVPAATHFPYGLVTLSCLLLATAATVLIVVARRGAGGTSVEKSGD